MALGGASSRAAKLEACTPLLRAQAEWRLTTGVALPWQPLVYIGGATEYVLNSDANKVCVWGGGMGDMQQGVGRSRVGACAVHVHGRRCSACWSCLVSPGLHYRHAPWMPCCHESLHTAVLYGAAGGESHRKLECERHRGGAAVVTASQAPESA